MAAVLIEAADVLIERRANDVDVATSVVWSDQLVKRDQERRDAAKAQLAIDALRQPFDRS